MNFKRSNFFLRFLVDSRSTHWNYALLKEDCSSSMFNNEETSKSDQVKYWTKDLHEEYM